MQCLIIPNPIPVTVQVLRYSPKVYVIARELEYCQEMLENLNDQGITELLHKEENEI